MTIVVPFDGSKLAEAALARAGTIQDSLGEDVVAVTIIPRGNTEYAREHGWLDDGAKFDVDAIVSHLRERVELICSGATLEYASVDRYASAGVIASRARRLARDAEATMVVVGSQEAGHAIISAASVGGKIALDSAYDVLIVRDRAPLDRVADDEDVAAAGD